MARVFREYERRKEASGALDFEDLLALAIKLLEDEPEVLAQVRERYRAFTVDEYQDVNLLQQTLLELWLGDRDELCAVGDDYQSIYAFTGATPEYLLALPQHFPNATVVRLEANYRSTPQVLGLANRLVPRLGGAEKQLRETHGPGPEPELRGFDSGDAEAQFVVERVRELHAAGTPLEEMAVLIRLNARSVDFEEAFSDAEIPFQSRALEGNLRVAEGLLEVDRARVQADQHGHLLEGRAGGVQLADALDDELRFGIAAVEAAQLGLRARPVRLAQMLLGAAEPRDEPVREAEHLRRRAVVGLQPNDGRIREVLRQRQQVLGSRAREGVDRLVVVADRAELVAVAEPELEQRLLQQVDVLVLVDREGAIALVHLRERLGLVLEQLDRQTEQILEVDRAGSLLAPLVLAEDAGHQVVRDRRLVAVQTTAVGLGHQPPVLRPLDLGREIDRGPELVRHRQRVADLPEHQSFGGEDPPGRRAAEPAQLRERGRMERPRRSEEHTSELQSPVHLVCRLLLEKKKNGRDVPTLNQKTQTRMN